MHRNPYASLATDEPRFQRPNSSTEVEGFKRGERVERVEGFKVEASAFPSLNGSSVKTSAPVWVVGQDTAKVIERALQTKTPPPSVQSHEPTFEPVEPVGMSSDEEDIPTFEEVCQGGSWGDSNWDD